MFLLEYKLNSYDIWYVIYDCQTAIIYKQWIFFEESVGLILFFFNFIFLLKGES